jgi:hypothetical protein
VEDLVEWHDGQKAEEWVCGLEVDGGMGRNWKGGATR